MSILLLHLLPVQHLLSRSREHVHFKCLLSETSHYRTFQITKKNEKENILNPCWMQRSRGVYVFSSTKCCFLLKHRLPHSPSGWPEVYFHSTFTSRFPLPALPFSLPSSQVAAASSDSNTLPPSCSSLWVALNPFVFCPRAADMILALCCLNLSAEIPSTGRLLPHEVKIRCSWIFRRLNGVSR